MHNTCEAAEGSTCYDRCLFLKNKKEETTISYLLAPSVCSSEKGQHPPGVICSKEKYLIPWSIRLQTCLSC